MERRPGEVVVDRETPVYIHVTRKKGGSSHATAKTISFAKVTDAENSPPAVYTTSRKGTRSGESSGTARRHVAEKDFDIPTAAGGSSTSKPLHHLRQGVPEAASDPLTEYEGSEPTLTYHSDAPSTLRMTDAADDDDVRTRLAESLSKIRRLEHTVNDLRYGAEHM